MSSSARDPLSEDAEALLVAACQDVFAERPDFFTEDKQSESILYARRKLVKNGVCTISKMDGLSRKAWLDMNLHDMLFEKMRIRLQDRASAASHSTSDELAIPVGLSSMDSGKSESSAKGTATDDTTTVLQTPDIAFGTCGHSITLRVNHFELKFEGEPRRSIWLMWQLDFPPFTPPSWTGETNTGASPNRRLRQREPGKELRQKAVMGLLQGIDSADWLYDGFHCLYTIKADHRNPSIGSHTISVAGSRGEQLSIKIDITPAKDQTKVLHDQKTLDLRRIVDRSHREDTKEELRFISVAMRYHSIQNPTLAVVGRRVVCIGHPLVAHGQLALQHGRELWRGYLAQANFVVGSQTGVTCTLSLNLVASVGVPQTTAIEFIATFLAQGRNSGYYSWYKKEMERNCWPKDLDSRMLETLNSEAGLQKLRVFTTYFGHERRTSVVGITRTSAARQTFEFEGSSITVADYFKNVKKVELWCPELPCLELGKPRNFVPLELVTVFGGEHNILAGKLRPEYQANVVRQASMKPSDRRDAIADMMKDLEMGPKNALKEKYIDVRCDMLKVDGHVLDAPKITDGTGSIITPNNYAKQVQAIAPPEYKVHWGLWYVTDFHWSEMNWFAKEFQRAGYDRYIPFEDCDFIERPMNYWKSYHGNDRSKQDALRADLEELVKKYKDYGTQLSLLVVVLPTDERSRKHFRGCLKMITELELGSNFATQCLEGRDAKKLSTKLQTLMMKLPGKLPHRITDGVRHGASHYIKLCEPHHLLTKRRTMIIGADVTHNAAGVSVSGVVATQDKTYVTYFSELRGQTPSVLEGEKTRRRKSEERIIDLSSMVSSLLHKWRQANGNKLPEVILYYRDGVSNGQFFDVLTRELHQLAEAFGQVGGCGYKPNLAIIVGQKRHQTRLFCEPQDNETSRKYNRKDPAQVPPGTVAGDGIATPGHMNFYLVAHEGIMGTSVPCHYHVLHLDVPDIGINDLERITYDLCHLYPRADKTVSYASPTYLADHLCERGKLYLETNFSDSNDVVSVAASGNSAEQEEKTREMIRTRVDWLNGSLADLREKGLDLAQGTNYFC